MNGKLLLVLSFGLACSLLARAALAADEPPKTHTLPKDGQTPVIVLDYKGGMILRVNDEPVLQVLADGTVRVGDPWGRGRKVEGKLSADEMQTLLRFILDQQKLGEITPDDLRMKGMMRVTDASTTTLTVDADGAQQKVFGSAVETVARQAGANSPAARFVAIARRLDHLTDVTRLGGPKGLQKILDAANATLKADHPAEGQVVEEDLLRATALKDGGTVAVFDHKVTLPGGKWHRVQVTVRQPETGEAKVEVKKGADQNG